MFIYQVKIGIATQWSLTADEFELAVNRALSDTAAFKRFAVIDSSVKTVETEFSPDQDEWYRLATDEFDKMI